MFALGNTDVLNQGLSKVECAKNKVAVHVIRTDEAGQQLHCVVPIACDGTNIQAIAQKSGSLSNSLTHYSIANSIVSSSMFIVSPNYSQISKKISWLTP